MVTTLGIRALRSASFRRTRRSATLLPVDGSGGGAPSAALFRWLFCACLAYQACVWLKVRSRTMCWASIVIMDEVGLARHNNLGIKWTLKNCCAPPHLAILLVDTPRTHLRSCQGSWAVALQTALLAGTAVATLGALPLLFLTASWYLSMAAPPEAPGQTLEEQQKSVSKAPGGRPPAPTISQRLLPGACPNVSPRSMGLCNVLPLLTRYFAKHTAPSLANMHLKSAEQWQSEGSQGM